MARKPRKLPDYFTPDEASALVAAAPSYQVRMAMRIMLWTGLPGVRMPAPPASGPAAHPQDPPIAGKAQEAEA